VPKVFMPAAHGLLNASEQIRAALAGLTSEQLLARPAGIASIAYHVRHSMGSLDRLYTYARGETLSDVQRDTLSAEKNDPEQVDVSALEDVLAQGVAQAIDQLRSTDESTALDHRAVGRAQLPSTVLGLLFHGAEHAARHAGQVVTTAKLVRGGAV
jgi:uncharacterized damage-inducible protein DinB